MLRFSSSPTDDMNIGDLRIALFNYIVSKQRNEDLVLRIEDTNKEKNIEGKDKEILDILDLFGVKYSQTLYQSEHVRFHTAMALQLLHEKKAFSCFCSNEWLDKKRKESKMNNKAYIYDDACANLPAELVIDNTNPFTIRIAKANEDIAIADCICGEVKLKSEDADSFIIMNQDKTPTYNFASAVDDMLSDISLVIRSQKHLFDAPMQEHIRASLKYDKKIEYAHLSDFLNDERLSVKSLLEEGFLPEAISNYLISIGNKPPKEIFTISEAIEWFNLGDISKSPTQFDIDVLKHINKEYLKMLDAKELSRYVGFADEEIGHLAKVYLEEVSTTKELRSKIKGIFGLKQIPEKSTKQSAVLSKAIQSAPYFDEYADFKNYLIKESGLEGKEVSELLRHLLTGEENGPDIAVIYKYIKNYIGEIVK